MLLPHDAAHDISFCYHPNCFFVRITNNDELEARACSCRIDQKSFGSNRGPRLRAWFRNSLMNVSCLPFIRCPRRSMAKDDTHDHENTGSKKPEACQAHKDQRRNLDRRMDVILDDHL